MNKTLMFTIAAVLAAVIFTTLVSSFSLSPLGEAQGESTDIAVTELNVIRPEFLQEGTEIRVVIVVSNLGDTDAEVEYNVGVQEPERGWGFGTCCIPIEANGTYTDDFNFTVEKAGQYTISASAYPNNMSDYNPDNNERSHTFDVLHRIALFL